MEKQFENLGVVIRSFKLEAISAKDAYTTDKNAQLLLKHFELETEINIARSKDLVLQTLCALGLERVLTDNQDDSTSTVTSFEQYNNLVEMETLARLPTKAASEAWAFKLSTEAISIFQKELRGTRSAENFDKILKLTHLLGDSVQQLQELTETHQTLTLRELKINQKLLIEKHKFSEELDTQRVELEQKSNIDKDAKIALMKQIYSKLHKTNTTRMLTNVLLTISDLDFYEKRPFIKLLKVCRNPATMEDL